MKKIDLVFLVTFQNLENIFNLIKTIKLNSKLNLLTILINQSGSSISILNTSYSSFIEISVDKNSLSFCRNVAVDYLLNNHIEFDHIMFIDDDSTFNSSFFDLFSHYIELNKNYIIDVYSQGSKLLYIDNNLTNNQLIDYNNYRSVFSVNMILSMNTFYKVKHFDFNLGAGALYGSGEDIDYFFRALKFGEVFIYEKNIYNFHPSSNNKYLQLSFYKLMYRFKHYGNGVIFALCKHRLYYLAFITCIRAIGGGLLSLMKFNFKLAFVYFYVFFTRSFLLSKLYFENLKNKYDLNF